MNKIPIQNIIEENEEEPILKQNKDERYILSHTKGKSDYHRVEGEFPWELRNRILKNHIGKPFDDAFSDYCKQVPKYQQHYFLDYFKPIENVCCVNLYQIDENGLIQKCIQTYKKPKLIVFESIDYKVEYRHKISGEKKLIHFWNYPFDNINYKLKYPKATNYYQAIDLYDKEFEPITISGWIREFESKKDPEYKRLFNEKKKELKKRKKLKEKEEKEKDNSLLSIQKQKQKEEVEKNLLKIKKLGFDPEISFHKDPENK
jgi:hypothetical protein